LKKQNMSEMEIGELLEALNSRQKIVFEYRVFYKKQFSAIADLLSVSESRAQQIYKKAVFKLKKVLTASEPLSVNQKRQMEIDEARQTTKRIAQWLNEGHLAGIIR
jgi:DNA-directed RNA polymerase sigma subunit (sigma70/sigma32)